MVSDYEEISEADLRAAIPGVRDFESAVDFTFKNPDSSTVVDGYALCDFDPQVFDVLFRVFWSFCNDRGVS